jgi:hypothetical protein
MRNKKLLRVIALVLCFNTALEIIFPTMAYALTSGPASPEFSKFQSVSVNDLVDPFSGNFNYSLPVVEVPGPDGAGYAMSLSYDSGVSSEEEASWVGFGWNLSPGAINRNLRGFPDDFSNAPIHRYNKTIPNFTYTQNEGVNLEFAAAHNAQNGGTDLNLSAGDTKTYAFNNHNGYSSSHGRSLGISMTKGVFSGSLGLSFENSEPRGATFRPTAEWGFAFAKKHNTKDHDALLKAKALADKEGRCDDYAKLENKIAQLSDKQKKKINYAGSVNTAGIYGMFSFSSDFSNASLPMYKRSSVNSFTTGLKAQVNVVGIRHGTTSYLKMEQLEPLEVERVYGYMNTPNEQEPNYLSDSYLERGTTFSKTNPYLGIPFNNADNFVVMGEGVGGSFRYYPNRVGIFYPKHVKNRTSIARLGFEFVVGSTIGVGINVGGGFTQHEIGKWAQDGDADEYTFSNPGEGFFSFAGDMGGEIIYGSGAEGLSTASLYEKPTAANNLLPYIRPRMNPGVAGAYDTGAGATRSSFITHNTLHKVRNNEKFNQLHKPVDEYTASGSTIAEMSVITPSGTGYVYGQPVYVRNETNLQFSVKNYGGQPDLIENRHFAYPVKSIPLGQNPVDNSYSVVDIENKDFHTIKGEIKQPAYANNFLLTQIYSHDYVDNGGKGCDKSDFGAWTQFWYHKKLGNFPKVPPSDPQPIDPRDPKDPRDPDDPILGGGSSPANNRDYSPWYRWRFPYSGLAYNQNSISDVRDDAGSVSTGEKEIYYLKSIETKTHIAFFVTNNSDIKKWEDVLAKMNVKEGTPVWNKLSTFLEGNGEARKDGLGAIRLTSGLDPMSSKGKKGEETLEYLNKIILFSKSDLTKPLNSTHFAYDYSLVKGLPNSSSTEPLTSGKLTLKKVWFEQEGVSEAKISPYEFSYAYKPESAFSSIVRKQYENTIFKTGNVFSSIGMSSYEQNPNYSSYLLDAWGTTQSEVDGANREKNGLSWKSQAPTTTSNRYDPAAWHLKTIKLPSGGEMLIEYEEKDYSSVQDRSPMAMTSLLRVEGEDTYVINPTDLGIDTATPQGLKELSAQAVKIRKYFVEDKNKIYFKFLYKLIGNGNASLDDCMSDYITGYASVSNVLFESNQIKIVLGGTEVITQKAKEEYVTTPREACYQFYLSTRAGLSRLGCQGSPDQVYDDIERDIIDGKGMFEYVFNARAGNAVTSEARKNTSHSKTDIGKSHYYPLSFLKLPMLKSKKGGGVRVKRLMTYDDGIETGDAVLYGQQYHYTQEETVLGWNNESVVITKSTGVATNEPEQMREENALVSSLVKSKQTGYDILTSGLERDQIEGPIGESLLPGASIGHQKVVLENIYTGTTGTGYTVYDYHTIAEYPFSSTNTDNGDNRKDYEIPIPGLGVGSDPNQAKKISFSLGLDLKHTHATQGYLFTFIDMHGKMKSVKSFEGIYTGKKEDKNPLVASTEYTYFDLRNEFMYKLLPNGTLHPFKPGKEMDVAMDMRSVKEKKLDFGLGADIGLALPEAVSFSLSINVGYGNKSLGTHTTSKIIRYPAPVKSVITMEKGLSTFVENLAFDGETGNCILTRTTDSYHRPRSATNISRTPTPRDVIVYDEDFPVGNASYHDGSVYALTLPAGWFYPELGKKAKNASNMNLLGVQAGSIITYGKDGYPIKSSPNGETWTFKNVIQASLQTYKKGWWATSGLRDELTGDYQVTAEAEQFLNTLYRPWMTFAYRSDVSSANASGMTIQKGGLIESITLNTNPSFWQSSTNFQGQPNWLKSGEVTEYSPLGTPLEEKNPLGIYSTAKYGYEHMLPTMVSNNARYKSIFYESYETVSDGTVSSEAFHSGKKSKKINVNAKPNVEIVTNLNNDDIFKKTGAKQGGALLKFWAMTRSGSKMQAYISTVSQAVGATIDLTPKAQVGDWALYEGYFPETAFTSLSASLAFTVYLRVVSLDQSIAANPFLYIDDVRFQPADAQSTCYVYDPSNFKILAQFDDQHFGLFYQYDKEGKLSKQLVETERGISVIADSQFNIRKKPR